MSGSLKQWMYAVWKYESAEYTWTNVGEQQSMIKIVRLSVEFSELWKIFNSWGIVFFDVRIFLIYLDLVNFMHYRTWKKNGSSGLWKIQGSSGLRKLLSCQT